jgi:hypothetical protein
MYLIAGYTGITKFYSDIDNLITITALKKVYFWIVVSSGIGFSYF